MGYSGIELSIEECSFNGVSTKEVENLAGGILSTGVKNDGVKARCILKSLIQRGRSNRLTQMTEVWVLERFVILNLVMDLNSKVKENAQVVDTL